MINYQMAHCPISCPFFRPIQSHRNLISSKSASIFLFYSIASSVSLHSSMFWISVPVEDPASSNVLYSFGAKVGWFKEFPPIIGTVWCDSPKFLLRKRGRKTQRKVSFISPSPLNERRKKRNKNTPDLTRESNSADMAYSLIIYFYSTGMVPAPCNRLFSATPSQRADPNIWLTTKKKCQHPQAGPYKCCLHSKIYYSKDHLSPGSIPLCKRGPCII